MCEKKNRKLGVSSKMFLKLHRKLYRTLAQQLILMINLYKSINLYIIFKFSLQFTHGETCEDIIIYMLSILLCSYLIASMFKIFLKDVHKEKIGYTLDTIDMFVS